jgi:hypothetical protein
MDSSDAHRENASASIRSSLDSPSNVNADKDSHPEKQASPRILRSEGIQIDWNDEHRENASASIRSSLEFDSNINDESDSHSAKLHLESRAM